MMVGLCGGGGASTPVDTGLYYLQSRYYDPAIGRFINADSLVSTGQGVLGYNMFAYCNNNPVCCSDPSGMLTDGQIHDAVLAAIILDYQESGYNYLSMASTLIYYNGKNIWQGWGYCDIYDTVTGEVWELKKASASYSCTTKYAQRQLGKYVNGRLKELPDLELSRGGDLVFGRQQFTISDSNGTYTVTYWQEGPGILRYSYTFQRKDNRKAVQSIRAALSLTGGAIMMVGLCGGGGASTPVENVIYYPAAKYTDLAA